MNAIIRKLKEDDVKELAHNIALVWDTTYKGIVDEKFIDMKMIVQNELRSKQQII